MPDSIWQVASSKAGRGREVHKKQNHEVIIVMSRGLELPACNTGSSLSPEEHTRAEELLLEVGVVSLLSLGEVLLCCRQGLHLLGISRSQQWEVGFGFSWKDIWLCQRSGGGQLGVFPAPVFTTAVQDVVSPVWPTTGGLR